MGWVDLASNPPCSLQEIQSFADFVVADGVNTVVLIGQGGSTQAPMTITKYNKVDKNRVSFKTLDSDSPCACASFWRRAVPRARSSSSESKSGGTIEPRLLLCAVREGLSKVLGEEEVVRHLVAVTDPAPTSRSRRARRGGSPSSR